MKIISMNYFCYQTLVKISLKPISPTRFSHHNTNPPVTLYFTLIKILMITNIINLGRIISGGVDLQLSEIPKIK